MEATHTANSSASGRAVCGYARLRRAHSKETRMSISLGKSKGRKLRASIAAAFRKIARAVDERTAHRVTQSFYRSSGMAWTRGLS
jgi:hypothetical protein